MMFKKILIPTDGSPLSAQAANAGVTLARTLGSEIVALYVTQPFAATIGFDGMAAAYAIKEGLWLRTLLSDLGMRLDTIPINADNQGAIKLLKNPVFSMRSKHIDVIYHFARERVTRKDITFKYIPTAKMVADALTKPLPKWWQTH